MTSYRRIEVKPIAGALGAEIVSVDLGTLEDETFREIEAAWLDHLVVFFRNQKEENDTRAFGEVWHTDQMFNPKPAKATILYAKETPDAGGDTLFANMYLAYDTLSDSMKEMLKGIKTWNAGDRKKLSRNDEMGSTRDGRYAGNEKMAAKVRDPGDLQTECAHPLVRTHPETGRKALYIGNHTQTLDGFKRAEARSILDFLMTHAVQPEFTCRFRWEVGSLAIWDNRCTQHRALNDYPGKRRRMHRITIAGDAPF